MKRIATSLFLMLVALMTWAQEESHTEYNFLRLPVSAHVAALGGDNITLVDDDVTLMFANPALLLGATEKTVTLSYMNYMATCNSGAAAYNMVFDDKWNIGIGAQFMSYGSMKQTDAANNDLGTFTANDIAVSGTLAYELYQNISGGVTAKVVHGNIGGYTSLACAVDLGLNYYNPEQELSVGMVAKNLGGQVKSYEDYFERMPIDLQMGVTKRLIGSPLRLTLTIDDMGHWSYKFIDHLVVGADVILSPQIYIAGGYNFRRAHEMSVLNGDKNEVSRGAGLSLGAGVMLDRFKIGLSYGRYHVSSSSIVANVAFHL